MPDSYPKTPAKIRRDETYPDLVGVQSPLLAKLNKQELLWNIKGLSPYESLKAIANGHPVSTEQVQASIKFLEKNAKRLDDQPYPVTLANYKDSGGGFTSATFQFEGEPNEWNLNWTGGTPTISNINNHGEYQQMMIIRKSTRYREPEDRQPFRIMYSVNEDGISSNNSNRVALDYNLKENKLRLLHGGQCLVLAS